MVPLLAPRTPKFTGLARSAHAGSMEKDNGQSPVPLIGWHDTTHDAASYADLQKLAALVYAL